MNSNWSNSNLISVIFSSPSKSAHLPHLHWLFEANAKAKLMHHLRSWSISHRISISQLEQSLKEEEEGEEEGGTLKSWWVRHLRRQEARGERKRGELFKKKKKGVADKTSFRANHNQKEMYQWGRSQVHKNQIQWECDRRTILLHMRVVSHCLNNLGVIFRILIFAYE